MFSLNLLQVTLGAATAPTQATSDSILARHLVIQNNNASNAVYIGDSTVETTAGIKIAAAGSLTIGPLPIGSEINLSKLYCIGTEADLVDVFYLA